MTHAHRFTLLPLALGLIACGSNDPELGRLPDLITPLALDDQVVLIDRSESKAFMIDTSEDPLSSTAAMVQLPAGPHLALRRNAYDEALVVCLGRRADETREQAPAALVALEPDGDQRVYELGDPFDRLEQSEDGRYALLFKSKSGTDERLLDNTNEIALVDLDKEPKAADAVTLRTLRSFGDSPDGVVFSPAMKIAGEDRRLAVVLSGASVTLLDLEHTDRLETTVQLAGDGATRVTPNQVVFDPSAPALYVRSSASPAVFVFNLNARSEDTVDDGAELHNDFRPSIDQIAVGANPSDMAIYGRDAGARLLVLSTGKLASLVDAKTGEVTSLKLPKQATHVLLFDAASPTDGEVAARALLYSDVQSTLTFVDLDDAHDTGTRAIDILELQHPVKDIVPMLEQRRALVLHEGQVASLVDLERRSALPIASPLTLSVALFDAERGRLWVGPAGQPYVAWLDLDTGATHELLLDAPIDRLLPQFASGRLAIVHQDAFGLVTVLDVAGDEPTRDDARSIGGFFAAGVLDRKE